MTREEYMSADNITEGVYDGRKGVDNLRAYYGQFVTPGMVESVARYIGAATLLASRDSHMNDIPMAQWDRLPDPHNLRAQLKAAGDRYSPSAHTCVWKTAARQWLAANGGAKLWPIRYRYSDTLRWLRGYAVGDTEQEAIANEFRRNPGYAIVEIDA